MEFIKGMDVSTLIEEESLGAKYYDNGVKDDALKILKRYGCNSVRLRLWNDPYSKDGKPYGAGTNDIGKTIALSKRAKELGMSILLDIHYSDFWADPGKQTVPKAWQGYDTAQLEEAVYDYTLKTMNILKKEGICPQMVQVGNEVTNGLLWPTGRKPWEGVIDNPAGYDNIARYISAGIRAVRESSGNTQVMIHLDNGGFNEMYADWFDNYVRRGEDFDIIGLSYYPFWHGKLEDLSFNMNDMAKRYGKKICIAEVSMGFSVEDYHTYEGKKPGEVKGMATKQELLEKLEYPMTKEGQCDFILDVMREVAKVKGGMGFYYWEPAWIPVPGCGWANEDALEYIKEKGPGGNEWANQALFDYDGNALPALKIIRDFKA
ncbi:MAG: glycosyl hydrolase 53 family protein [Lachnospiraceae bacterium]|nr:glycosyl hydrolase 53 family protein [Lachnospiraceae bacterium]